jgi:hypothetical protein
MVPTPGGADFAEWFESADGRSYPSGTTVTILPNAKFKKSGPDDIVHGVVSDTAAFVGGLPEYVEDAIGESGTTYKLIRPGWHVIGLLGIIAILHGEPVAPHWFPMHTKKAPDGKCYYLVKKRYCLVK